MHTYKYRMMQPPFLTMEGCDCRLANVSQPCAIGVKTVVAGIDIKGIRDLWCSRPTKSTSLVQPMFVTMLAHKKKTALFDSLLSCPK